MKSSFIPMSLRVTVALCFLSTTSPVDANLMPFMNPYQEVAPDSRRSLSHNVGEQEEAIKNLIYQLKFEATRREIEMKRRLKRGHTTIDTTKQTNDNNKVETTHRGLSTKKSGLSSSRKFSKKSSTKPKGSDMVDNEEMFATKPPTQMEVISTSPSTMQAEAPIISEDQSNISGNTSATSEDQGAISVDDIEDIPAIDTPAISEDRGPISGDSPAMSEDQDPISGDSLAMSEDQGSISGDSPAVSEDGNSAPLNGEEQREENPDIDNTVPINDSDGGNLTDGDQDGQQDDTTGEEDTPSVPTDTEDQVEEEEISDQSDTANGEDNQEPTNDEDEGSITNDVDVNDGDEAVEEEVEILTDLWEFAMVRTVAGTPDSEEDFNLTSVIAMAGVVYDFNADGNINTDETVGEFSAICVVVSKDHNVLCTYMLRFLTPDGTFGLGELTARGHVVDHQNENPALVTGTAFDWAQYQKGGNLVMQPDPEDSLTLLCSLTLRYAKDAAIN